MGTNPWASCQRRGGANAIFSVSGLRANPRSEGGSNLRPAKLFAQDYRLSTIDYLLSTSTGRLPSADFLTRLIAMLRKVVVHYL
jgi:hypothetical protein